jgi:hypothetical protein
MRTFYIIINIQHNHSILEAVSFWNIMIVFSICDSVKVLEMLVVLFT